MRYKDQIDKALDEAFALATQLRQEVESGQPYVTREYVSAKLLDTIRKIDTASHLLTLEDE